MVPTPHADAHDDTALSFDHLDVRKMPAHWLMARLGKRVLRPGGIEMTRWLLQQGRVTAVDDVIEFAPGLGRTAALILAGGPRSYAGIERDAQAAHFTECALARAGFARAPIVHGNATAVPMADDSATMVVGEAMLSMQTPATKRAIMSEAFRLLRPDGRYLIHELAVAPDSLDAAVVAQIQKDLSEVIHVGVRIGTVREWTRWLEDLGFTIEQKTTMPMRLLEPDRMMQDEGLRGVVKFLFNAVRTPGAVRRLRAVRGVFRKHREHLCAVGIIARKGAGYAAGAHAAQSELL